ncbi:hypothetical protein NSQ89_15010 [Niallia sp. FSL R7-0648]|uniref:hypothetical protein n=1 Tax=Niallia sp. FSL R7-0648 TaxID=2954521 RepID=UPI0030F9780E
MSTQITWSIDWIQDYESPWGIIEKFKWANAIEGNEVLELLGNDNIKRLKKISNAGIRHRNLMDFSSIDPKLSQKIIGINIKEYHDKLIDKLIHIIPNIKYVSKYFYDNLSYCPKCISTGYHSIFHQIKLFDHCPFHPNQELINKCPKCKQTMPEYIINKGDNEPYHCSCGYSFLDSKNIRSIFTSWKIKPKIQSEVVDSWQRLPRQVIHKNLILYPFEYYTRSFEIDTDNTNLSIIPKILINAFDEEKLTTGDFAEFSSNRGVFKVKNDYHVLKENYIRAFPELFYYNTFNEKHRIDSFFFEIFKQTRSIYKAISRYLLNKTIKEHKKCVHIFNKARQNGDVCPFALAFIWWRMECEGKSFFSEIETHNNLPEPYEFNCLDGQFSFFPKGQFITHLDEILNPINKNQGLIFLECNSSSIIYILNRILSHLLIDRFIKWLEIVQNPEKNRGIYPDDNISMYIAKIPRNMDGEISFHFQKGYFEKMDDVLKRIHDEKICPTKKTIKYPPYRSPAQKAIDRMGV